ncbi:hypothetical protein J1614_010648 [Plenodomus biglobosus]|nr:hypothetical protein J1614_010648 [Plenodomus biglobosus]
MSIFVQSRIDYTFENEQIVELALRSVHRDKHTGEGDDGNRGLAHYGVLAISMVETHNVIVESEKTLRELARVRHPTMLRISTDDLHVRNHWWKTKKGRAAACRSSGFERFIVRSARQHHQSLSDVVLDNALSAIIGGRRGRTTAVTRRTLWEVLCSIDDALTNSSLMASEDSALLQMNYEKDELSGDSLAESGTPTARFGAELDDIGKFAQGWSEWVFDDTWHDFVLEQPGFSNKSPLDFPIETENDHSSRVDLVVDFGGYILTLACAKSGIECEEVPCKSHDALDETSAFSSSEELRNTNVSATPSSPYLKRRRSQGSRGNDHPIYSSMLFSEQQKLDYVAPHRKDDLARFLEIPQVYKSEKNSTMLLRFLQSGTAQWTAAETYREICRLEGVETLNILMRRYYTINLYEHEREEHRRCNQIIVETPHTIGLPGRSNAGNPILTLDASLTDQLVRKIMPNTEPGSKEFKKARRKVKRLRRLARYLRVLIDSYGIGILALLPSGPSFGDISLTDNVLLSMTEVTFNHFIRVLHREQGPLLVRLSKFVESSLLALATCSLETNTVCPFERIDITCLEYVPKGLLDLSQCPLVSERLV